MSSEKCLKVGVLAIQGAFIEHIRMLEGVASQSSGVSITVCDVRKPEQLSDLDGLIIPGGESTTLSVFLKKDGFEDALREWMGGPGGKPGVVWGTCAGLILLSDELLGQKKGGQSCVSLRVTRVWIHMHVHVCEFFFVIFFVMGSFCSVRRPGCCVQQECIWETMQQL